MFLFKSFITNYADSYAALQIASPRSASAINIGVLYPDKKSNNNTDILSYDILKNGMDVLGAGFLLLVHLPILLIIALAIRVSSSGPVIFKQKRITKNGKIFTMYKFRTMYQDAESKTGAVWAKKKDPRITCIGKFLRVSRLDELPQLFNVLIGDMSLIGPRPERPEFATQLEKNIPNFERRLEVKAGITGLAQIANGYSSSLSSYKRKIAYDINYVDNRSLSLDLVIALNTIAVIITGFGAK